MATLPLWIEATRPKTLIASISPVLIGSAMTAFAGFFNATIFLYTLLTGLFIQIGTNFANDYFDFKKGIDSQGQRLGPRKLIAENLLSLNGMKFATILAFSSALLSALPLIWERGAVISALLCLAVLLGIFYSAGKHSFSHLGLGDLLVVLFFGSVATGGTFYLQTGVFLWDPFIAGLAPGLLSCAILCIDNLRDYESDRLANKRSLPVRFGKLFGKLEYFAAMTIPFIIPFILVRFFFYQKEVLIALLAFIPALALIFKVFTIQEAKDYAPLLKKTAAVLAIYTLLFCLGLLI